MRRLAVAVAFLAAWIALQGCGLPAAIYYIEHGDYRGAQVISAVGSAS